MVSGLRGQKSLQIGFWELSNIGLSDSSGVYYFAGFEIWTDYFKDAWFGLTWDRVFVKFPNKNMPSVDVTGVADIPSELSTCL